MNQLGARSLDDMFAKIDQLDDMYDEASLQSVSWCASKTIEYMQFQAKRNLAIEYSFYGKKLSSFLVDLICTMASPTSCKECNESLFGDVADAEMDICSSCLIKQAPKQHLEILSCKQAILAADRNERRQRMEAIDRAYQEGNWEELSNLRNEWEVFNT